MKINSNKNSYNINYKRMKLHIFFCLFMILTNAYSIDITSKNNNTNKQNKLKFKNKYNNFINKKQRSLDSINNINKNTEDNLSSSQYNFNIDNNKVNYPFNLNNNSNLIISIQNSINKARESVAKGSTVLYDKLNKPTQMLKAYYNNNLANEALKLVRICPNLNNKDYIKFNEWFEIKNHGYIYSIDSININPFDIQFWNKLVPKIFNSVLERINLILNKNSSNKNNNNNNNNNYQQTFDNRLPDNKTPLLSYDEIYNNNISLDNNNLKLNLNSLINSYNNLNVNYLIQYFNYEFLHNFLTLLYDKNYLFGCAVNKCKFSNGSENILTICKFNDNLREGEPVYSTKEFDETKENDKNMMSQLIRTDSFLWAIKGYRDANTIDNAYLNFNNTSETPLYNKNINSNIKLGETVDNKIKLGK